MLDTKALAMTSRKRLTDTSDVEVPESYIFLSCKVMCME